MCSIKIKRSKIANANEANVSVFVSNDRLFIPSWQYLSTFHDLQYFQKPKNHIFPFSGLKFSSADCLAEFVLFPFAKIKVEWFHLVEHQCSRLDAASPSHCLLSLWMTEKPPPYCMISHQEVARHKAHGLPTFLPD